MLPVDTMIYVVDDDADVCKSLVFLLRAEGFAALSFASADEMLAQVERLPRGIVISDIRMPGTDGVGLIERLRASGRDDPLILISGHADIPIIVSGMRKGATNFLPKPFSRAELIGAINEVAQEAEKRAPRQVGSRIDSLSPRERQVLDLLIGGLTNKDIAQELDISARTVEEYRAKMMAKMGAKSLSSLLQSVIASGYRPGLARPSGR